MVAPTLNPYYQKRQNLAGLANSAMGSGPAFPGGTRFSDFGRNQSNQILGFADEYGDVATKRRTDLMKSLTDLGQQQFQMANPYILEDLNRRGLATSPTAVGADQANALKEISLANQAKLFDLQSQDYATEDALRRSALEANLGAEQTGLEYQLGEESADREAALANQLAREQRRAQLSNSLIGVGGNVLGGLLSSGGGLFGGGGGGGGLLGGLFGGGGAVGAGGAAGTGGGIAGAAPAAIPLLPVGAAIGGALALRNALKKGTLGSVGQKVHRYMDPLNPLKSTGNIVKDVGKGVKKVFCFTGMMRIELPNGMTAPIAWIMLGDKIKGGRVESVRQAIAKRGELYNYKGIEVTGSHAVKEDGVWIRVSDSPHAVPLKYGSKVYSLCTTDHRIFINGLEFADEIEHDDYENLTIDESLAKLNNQAFVEVSPNGA
jgi:hypothetical protein